MGLSQVKSYLCRLLVFYRFAHLFYLLNFYVCDIITPYVFAVAYHYLFGVYKPGASRFVNRLGVAGHAAGPFRRFVLRRRYHNDNRGRYRRVQSAVRQAHPQARRRTGYGSKHCANGGGFARLFLRNRLLAAVPNRRSLRSRRGRNRRRPQQLRRSQLFFPPHELASLLLGLGRAN